MPIYDGKISSFKLKMEKLRMELLDDKYKASKERYIQSIMSELAYISQLAGIISNQRKTLDLLKRLRGKCPWMETYPPSQIS